VLLNKKAEYGDRSDAATDLAAYDEPEAEAALAQVAMDPSEDEDLLDHCGEALATIWCRKGRMDSSVFAKMPPPARTIAEAIIRDKSPRLLGSKPAS